MSPPRKEIWLPSSETKVTVTDGEVTVWTEMKMTLRPVNNPAGFKEDGRAVDNRKT